MMACSYGHFEIARWLVDLGANIDLQDKVSRALSFCLTVLLCWLEGSSGIVIMCGDGLSSGVVRSHSL